MKPRRSLSKLLIQNRICLLSFLLPFFAMLAIFIGNGIYPFGDGSFMHSDMYHQYVPFLQEFLTKVKSGDSLSYSWEIGVGSNFLALYIYYCASPFNWLMLLLPQEYLIEFMSYLVIFKIGLCGFTFAYYLRHHFHTDSWLTVFFSLFYAMSGFVAAYNWNVMWMDCLFLTPLILLGLERLIQENRGLLYCASLTLSILTNYYISIMICFYLCLYALLLLSELRSQAGLWAALKRRVRPALSFALYSLLAGGMAAFLLLPELCALHFTEFSEFRFPQTVTYYFSFLDMIARHATGVTTEAGLDHWPNLFCSSAVFFLLPLYVFNRSIPARQKIGRLLLCAFFLLSFATNTLNFIWHGFNYPDSLPARQSFLYIFLVLTLCFEAVHRLEGFGANQLLHAFCLGFGFLLLSEKLVEDDAFTTSTFLISMGFLCAYGLLLLRYRQLGAEGGPSFDRALRLRLLALFALAAVTFEATYNMAYTSVSTTSRSEYLDALPAYRALAGRTQAADPDFYRFEKFSRVTKNDGALAGYPTASCFSSTANSYVGDWYGRMGMSESKVFYCFDGQTPFSAALLNVRYLFSRSSLEDTALYEPIDEENGIYLYQSRYTLPAGFLLDDRWQLSSQALEEFSSDPLELQNRMAASVLGGEASGEAAGEDTEENAGGLAPAGALPLFVPVETLENGGKAVLTAELAGHYYAYARNGSVNEVKLASDSLNKTFKKLKYSYIMDLGWHEAGEEITLTNSDKGELDLAAYRLDPQVLSSTLAALGSQGFTVDSYDSTHVTGHIDAACAGRLLISIAYEPGWAMKVDGEPVEIERYDDLFISTWLTAGAHTVELTFFPAGLIPGIVISLLCAAAFALLCLRVRAKRAYAGAGREADLQQSGPNRPARLLPGKN